MLHFEHELVDTDKKFLDYHVKLRSSLSEKQTNDFKSLTSSKERILFVTNLPNRPAFSIEVRINRGKNLQEARTLKNKGNAFFQRENYELALSFYSQALLKSSENVSGRYIPFLRLKLFLFIAFNNL